MLLGFKLMIQNGEYKNFFLYTVFFKKTKQKRKEIVQRGQTYQFHALTLEKLYDVQEWPEMKALSIFLLGFTDQCGNFNFI